MKQAKIKLFNDNFQNYKGYGIPSKAQLVIADKNKSLLFFSRP